MVHPEKGSHKRKPEQKDSTRNIYRKWMKEQEKHDIAEERMMTPDKRFVKNFFTQLMARTYAAFPGIRIAYIRIHFAHWMGVCAPISN